MFLGGVVIAWQYMVGVWPIVARHQVHHPSPLHFSHRDHIVSTDA